MVALPELSMTRRVSYTDETLRYVVYYPCLPVKAVILGIHGGCFHEGDETWNCEQFQALAQRGFCMVACNFRQTYLFETLYDLCQAWNWLLELEVVLKNDPPLGVLGNSSGGFFALLLSRYLATINFALLLTPVTQPYWRQLNLASDHPCRDQILSRQMRYFQGPSEMKCLDELVRSLRHSTTPEWMTGISWRIRALGGASKATTCVVLGSHDTNAPLEMNLWMALDPRVELKVLEGGHELGYSDREDLMKVIETYIYPPRWEYFSGREAPT